MKRGGPLPRYTPPRSSSTLRGTALSRKARAPLARTPLLTRRPTVTALERAARKTVAVRSGGLCELGILCSGGAYGTDYSHRVGRAQGGPWCPANGGWSCRSCHGWLHLNPVEARVRTGWMLRRSDDFRTFPVFHAVHGWVLLGPDGTVTPTAERPEA